MGIRGGEAIRYYRENRLPDGNGPRLRLTQLALIEWLNRMGGWNITSGQWSEIESGKTDLPRYSENLLPLLKDALNLNDSQFDDLQSQFAWDVVASRMGEVAASKFVPQADFTRGRRGTF